MTQINTHHGIKRFASARFECKATPEGDGAFTGYASVFHVKDDHDDVVLPGAFEDSVGAASLPLLWQHRQDEPIGKIIALQENLHGLYVEGRINLNVAKGKEAYALLTSGALDGLSIGYEVESYRHDPAENVRLLVKVKLWEISLVTFPANRAARVQSIKNALKACELKELTAQAEAIAAMIRQSLVAFR